MKLVTSEQMARIDELTIQKYKIPGVKLMEQAGKGIFELVGEVFGETKDKRVVVLCGRGNNGGDGFVVARLLSQSGASVLAFLTAQKDQLKPDPRTNLERAAKSAVNIKEITEDKDLEIVKEKINKSDFIVDALLGVGIKGSPRGLAASLIEIINKSEKPVIAVDVPSGLGSEPGEIQGPCVQAYATATFGLPKISQAFHPGRTKCGKLKIVDIGTPSEAIEEEGIKTNLITLQGARALLPKRPPFAHKGDCGKVAVLAGSVGMTGAAALTAESALQIGAGLVKLGIPASLNDIMETKLTEVMTKPLPEVRKRRCLALRGLGEIVPLINDSDSLAIGPGIGTYRETKELVHRTIKRTKVPIVVDADALNGLAENPSILKESQASIVVTPHPGELSRLTGKSTKQITSDPLSSAKNFSVEFGVTTVLKGAPTVISTTDGQLYVNSTGNAGMATGGAGDVLTGAIAGLIGQGMQPNEASILAVFIHGKAGDLAKDQKGEMGLKAGDILRCLPDATLLLEK